MEPGRVKRIAEAVDEKHPPSSVSVAASSFVGPIVRTPLRLHILCGWCEELLDQGLSHTAAHQI